MRLAIAGAGYQGAVEAYVTGNHLAADCCTTLADRLGGCAGMAGTTRPPPSSRRRTTRRRRSPSRRPRADLRAVIARAPGGGVAAQPRLGRDRDRAGTPADRAVGCVLQRRRPRWGRPLDAAGVGAPGARGAGRVFWPTADTGRLQTAAATWRSAAVSVGCWPRTARARWRHWRRRSPRRYRWRSRRPEDLRGRIEALADHLSALGSACGRTPSRSTPSARRCSTCSEQLAWGWGSERWSPGDRLLHRRRRHPAAGAAGARLAAASAWSAASWSRWAPSPRHRLRPAPSRRRRPRHPHLPLPPRRRPTDGDDRARRLPAAPWSPPRWLAAEKPPGHTPRAHPAIRRAARERLARKRHLPNASTDWLQADAESDRPAPHDAGRGSTLVG